MRGSDLNPGVNALELFCGIGGFAAARAQTNIRVVGALDQNTVALNVYRLNFPDHVTCSADLERIGAAALADFDADLWWLSPPCQPYSVRGRYRDLDDPRARSLARILSIFKEIPSGRRPRHLIVENVAGFFRSQARELLTALLTERGYQIREQLLCPTKLGVPSRRPRYYLVASREGLLSLQTDAPLPFQPLWTFLNPTFNARPPADLIISADVIARFGAGLRIIDPVDATAYTTCFTAAYGKSLMHAGSYLRCSSGVRRFAPEEIASLLHFPPSFCFPEALSLRKRWHLLGNSLSVAAVREVLKALPGLNFPVLAAPAP